MEGAVAALGIGAGLLGIIEPMFRPLAAGSIVVGAGFAVILVWRRLRKTNPTISRHADTDSDTYKPIEPK